MNISTAMINSVAAKDAEIVRLRTKINKMLEILWNELPRATRRRVSERFNRELDNRAGATIEGGA